MIRILSATAAFILFAVAAQAGSFTVNPVRLELANGQAATSLMISNAGRQSGTFQVSVHEWSHQNGEDRLLPASGPDAPIVTPPLFRVDGNGGSQVVRIGFANASAAQEEGRWRVIVEEVPMPYAALGPARDHESPAQIEMRLRVSLPLFRMPVERKSDLVWSTESDGAALRLAVENRGTTTERIDEASLASESGLPLTRLAGPVYVFPGEHRSFALAEAARPAAGLVRLSVQGSAPALSQSLGQPVVSSDLVLRAQ